MKSTKLKSYHDSNLVWATTDSNFSLYCKIISQKENQNKVRNLDWLNSRISKDRLTEI